MLMALLLPDPCDPCCPPEFKQDARRSYERLWWKEGIGPEEVLFDDRAFLLTRAVAASLKQAAAPAASPSGQPPAPQTATPAMEPGEGELVLTGTPAEQPKGPEAVRLRLAGPIPLGAME